MSVKLCLLSLWLSPTSSFETHAYKIPGVLYKSEEHNSCCSETFFSSLVINWHHLVVDVPGDGDGNPEPKAPILGVELQQRHSWGGGVSYAA